MRARRNTQAFRVGDYITIAALPDGERPRFEAGLVSFMAPNGRTAVLIFNAMIGGWAGHMPVQQDADGAWTALDGMPVVLARRPV